MYLCTACKSSLADSSKFCPQCGAPVQFAYGGPSSLSTSSQAGYMMMKEERSTYSGPITPLPFTTTEGGFHPPDTSTPLPSSSGYTTVPSSPEYTTPPPSSGYTTLFAPDYNDIARSSALYKDTPLPSLYPYANPYREGLAEHTGPTLPHDHPYREGLAEHSGPTLPPRSPQKISTRPLRKWMLWLLIALACLLVSGSVVSAFQFASHSTVSNSPHKGANAPAVGLNVQPSSLNFGTLPKGSTVILAVLLANTGRGNLRWSVDTGGISWLSIAGTRAGTAGPNQAQQAIYTVVDTRQLPLGNYTGVENIYSNGGNIHIPITVGVGSANGRQQAKLNVNPSMLNFGTLSVNQQATSLLTIGNTGTQHLSWKASTSNAHWLTLDHTSGMVLSGHLPGMLKVTANTAHLLPGSYSTLLNITSNGGNLEVGVTMVISAPLPSTGGLLNVSPSNFINGCLSCIITLSSPVHSRGNVNWKVASMGIKGIRLSPASGSLAPGRTMQVTASVPNVSCPSSAVFSFTGAVNNASVLWSCIALPTPAPPLAASPNSFIDGCLACDVALSPAAGSQGTLNWSTSSTGISGIRFSPASGTLKAGQVVHVTVSVPQQNCPASAIFTFKGPGNTAFVPWSCSATQPPPTVPVLPTTPVAPTLTVNASSLDTSSCSANGDGTYTCTVSLGETAQGDLSWSASSTMGGSFSPPSGQLSAGQSQQTVTISSIPCQSGSFTFTGSSNTVTVAWSCSSASPPLSPSPTPPALAVSPGSLDASSCSANGDGTYTCTVNVSESTQGDVSWSASSSMGGTLSQASGQLSTGQPQQSVTISSIPCQSGSLTFTGQSNTVTVPWSCTPVAPSLSISPGTLDASSNCSYTGSSFTCSLTFSTNADATSNLTWTAAGTSATFTPASGTLSPGQSQSVTLSVPDSASQCPLSASFSVTDQNGKSYSISFSCPAPPITIPSTMTCTQNSDSTWTCPVTISLGQYSFGSLPWTVTNDTSGLTFDQSSGELTSNGSATVTVTIPAISCPASASIHFSYNSTSVPVSWSC